MYMRVGLSQEALEYKIGYSLGVQDLILQSLPHLYDTQSALAEIHHQSIEWLLARSYTRTNCRGSGSRFIGPVRHRFRSLTIQ